LVLRVMVQRTLDTNICSYILRRRPQEMVDRFSALDRSTLWISAIVASELRFGAVKLGAPKFKAAVEAWLNGFELRPWPLEASHHYAQLRFQLEQRGQPIDGMDLMIAAHARAEDSVIITNNVREFLRVPGLAVEAW
jgi:tRNA(fMet)-specific endonuclease VapC